MSSTKSDRKTLKKEKLEPLSIKDFQIYKQLGKGQNGKIYSAFHLKTGMIVALKHFQQNKVIIDYLIDEMKIQLFSVHPNILAAFGYIIEKSSTIDTTGVYIEEEEKSKSRTFYNIYIIMEKGEFNLFSLIRKEKHLN